MSGELRLCASGVLCLILLSLNVNAKDLRLVEEMQSPELRHETSRYNGVVYRYGDGEDAFRCVLCPPSGVRPSAKKVVPVVVHIPGNGEIGDPIRQFRQRRIFEHVMSPAFQKANPCYLLAISPPQSATTLHGGMPGQPSARQRMMHDMISSVIAAVRSPGIDPGRIYVTGFSYGGSGAYALALHYPGEYAAVVPIASLPPLPEYFCPENPGCFWHFHNEGDYAESGMAVGDVESFRDRVNAAGGDFRIGTYPSNSHDAWTAAWSEGEVWKWMFSKSKEAERMASSALTGAKCSASCPGQDGCGPERVVDGLDNTCYRPARCFGKGDWWMVELARPVIGNVAIYSGGAHGELRLSGVSAEVSMNGKSWTPAGTFLKRNGVCTFSRSSKFRFVRVRAQNDLESFSLRRMTILQSR